MKTETFSANDVTFVVIGRNEGKLLERCFLSVLQFSKNIIYVDSNSEDNSVEIAKRLNINNIFHLKSNFYSASLGRYVGARNVKTKYIQFLDGDMEIDSNWIGEGIHYLEKNIRIAAVIGFKKVFKNSMENFKVLSDKKDWQPDYLGGAILIKTKVYHRIGGFDPKLQSEEERDLYVRLKHEGYQSWYLHRLLGSHYDLKNRNLYHTFFSGSQAGMWLTLFKSIQNRQFKSYLFVYRLLIFPLLCDIVSIATIFLGLKNWIILASALQLIEIAYCKIINRPGYFILWKSAFFNIFKAYKIHRRKIKFEVNKI